MHEHGLGVQYSSLIVDPIQGAGGHGSAQPVGMSKPPREIPALTGVLVTSSLPRLGRSRGGHGSAQQ